MTKPHLSTQEPGVVGLERLFADLFDAEYDFVFHSLRRLGVHKRDLEDLAHDTFVKVYENRHRYDPERPPRPWLFAFAFRIASDYRRLARHKTELGGDNDDHLAASASAEEEAMTHEAARIAEAALLAIPIEHRAVFVMYELDETPMKTIAESLQIPLNTAYSRLRLARAGFAAEARRLRESEPKRALARPVTEKIREGDR